MRQTAAPLYTLVNVGDIFIPLLNATLLENRAQEGRLLKHFRYDMIETSVLWVRG